jgi:hypothetical protein
MGRMKAETVDRLDAGSISTLSEQVWLMERLEQYIRERPPDSSK